MAATVEATLSHRRTAAPPRMSVVSEFDSTHAPNERFRILFDLNYEFIWRLVGRLGVPQEAVDDVAQEIFIIAARRIRDIRPGSERPFLFGIARRLSAEARRVHQRKKHVVSDDVLEELAHPDASPEDVLATRRAQRLLDEMLDAMADDTREAFVLFELEGLSKSEVATVLGIPEGTAASRLRRGREEFLSMSKRLKLRLACAEGGGR